MSDYIKVSLLKDGSSKVTVRVKDVSLERLAEMLRKSLILKSAVEQEKAAIIALPQSSK